MQPPSLILPLPFRHVNLISLYEGGQQKISNPMIQLFLLMLSKTAKAII